jgi:hypothetical protein
MANDRIFIRCTSCGKRVVLTKHYPSMELGELALSPEKLSVWLSEHLHHHPKQGAMFLDGIPGLFFETESKLPDPDPFLNQD